jgi:hypothetical protein
MSIDVNSIVNGVISHTAASGWFDRVQGHEVVNAPGHGLTAAVWIQRMGPLGMASGLSVTSGRLVLMQRLYQNALSEPRDAIDPNLILAADALFTAYSGDFDLGGTIRNVDLLGAHGIALEGEAGYLDVSGKMFRIFDITIPLIINDLWTQAA